MAKKSPAYARAYLDDLTVRAIDQDKRQATFVAATERGVLTWGGREYLRMSGVNLKRFRKNPVILDTHDRVSAGAVIGKGEVWTEGRQLMLTVTFAQTARAEEIWSLVVGGFLRAVSVGFMPGPAKKLAEGESDVENSGGKPDESSRIDGPATVIKSWELFEVSVVPVPADPDAVRRELGAWLEEYGADLTVEEREKSTNASQEELVMNELFMKWAKARNLSLEGIDAAKRAELEAQCQRELGAGLEPAAPEAPAEPVNPAAPSALAQEIRAMAPRHLDAKTVDQVVLESTDLADAKKRLLALTVVAPVGTTEPAQPTTSEQAAEKTAAEQKKREQDLELAMQALKE